jgi:long-chain acyl-CoA synthetase
MTNLDLHRFSSLQEALHHFIGMQQSHIALIEVDRDREKIRFTYEELNSQAQQFATTLNSRTHQDQIRMGIIMSNQSKWIISATGLFYSGGILVPLDYKLTPEDQLKLIEHSQIQVLVTEFPLWKRMKTVDTSGILEKILVFVSETPEKEIFHGRTHRWENLDAVPAHFAIKPKTREDIACIVYSSGTGGTPKGCMLTHNNYLSQAQSLSELYPINQDDTYFSFIPTNHAIDFMCGYLLPLFFGSKIVHQRTLRPEFFASTIQTYKISHMALVPLLLKTLEDKIRNKLKELPPLKKWITNTLISINALVTRKTPKYGFSRALLAPIHKTFGGHLRLIFAGGAFVESSTAQFFYDLGIPVVIGYGLTEAGTVLTVNDLNPFRANTVGKPLSITEVKINNPDSTGVGEVWVKGQTIMKGYFNADELTQETMENGWLKTGDLGKMDHGHLILLGRQKNMIVTPGGKNVYPEDIETSFDRIGGVEEYCILAKRLIWPTSDLTTDSMVLVIKPKDDAKTTDVLNEVRTRNRSLADYKRVSETLIWNATFSRTASMKIKRNQLADEISKATPPSSPGLVQL